MATTAGFVVNSASA